MTYNLELKKAVSEIKKAKAKTVMLQLPDGLKPEAGRIQDEIVKETGVDVLIWAGSCFGACDTPVGIEKLGVDLLLQWGHSQWK